MHLHTYIINAKAYMHVRPIGMHACVYTHMLYVHEIHRCICRTHTLARHTHIHVHTYMHACIHTSIHASIYTCKHACVTNTRGYGIRTYVSMLVYSVYTIRTWKKHTHTHKIHHDIHTYMHTYTHSCIADAHTRRIQRYTEIH
jgi:hypothetical protein